jgi:NADPH:quinone reductase-like Zn-dependent oxidoreductase
MTPPTTYQAAWLPAKYQPFELKSTTYTPPAENEIVVKNAAVAINPLDWFKQDAGDIFGAWIKYPFILGSDSAGEVVEVGKGVTRFKVGDRVLGNAVSFDQRSNKSSEGAFQEYTVLRTNLACPIPDSMTYESACVLPLGLSTAACGLFMPDYLGLPFPTLLPKPSGKTLLVWGASSSVGCNAVQLATLAGYDVIATASPQNHELLKKLGAVEVFDYRSPTVVRDISAALQDRNSAGAFAIGPGSVSSCVDVLASCKGRKFIAQATFDRPAGGFPRGPLDWPVFGMKMGIMVVSGLLKQKLKGVGTKPIWGTDLMANEVGKAIYEEFLPQALAEGKYIAAPDPQVVGKGLEHVQEAMNLNKKGVSAKKLVVTL